MRKLIVAVFGLTVVFLLLAACGGGGASGPSGLTPLLTVGGDLESSPPGEGEGTLEAVDVEPPQVAESAGEIGGIVADYLGTPIPDLEIYLNSTGNVVSSTDDSGEFLASGVASGDHKLVIGVEGIEVASFDVSYDDALPLNVALSPAGARTVSEYSEFGSLVGVVTDMEGTPLEGVKVLVFNDDRFFLLARTNAHGEYEFARIPAGEYRLLGFKRGYRTYVGEVAIRAGEVTRHDFVMRGYTVGRVIGTVYDEEGNTLPRSHIFLLYRDQEEDGRTPPAFHTMTGLEGHYAFNDVPAGEADMLAFKPGYEPEDAEVVVPPLGFIVQDFVLHGYPPPPPPPPAYAILTGFVHSGPDHPIGGALVELIRGEGLYFSTESNDDGFYRFDELPIGEYVFEVSAEGYEAIRGELRLLPGHNIRNFFLRPHQPPPGRGAIVGTVYRPGNDDPDGRYQPVPGAEVTLFHGPPESNRPPIGHTRTDERGRYAFEGLPPSGDLPYVVVAQREFPDGLWRGIEDTFLREGQVVTLDIYLHPVGPPGRGAIVGTVYRPGSGVERIPVPGAEVALFHGPPEPGRPPLRQTRTDEYGRYAFEELAPSGDMPYLVIARKDFADGPWEGAADTLLREGERVTLDIMLHPAGPPSEPGTIFGLVWRMGDETGGLMPVSGAWVKLFHGPPDPGRPPFRVAETNERGMYCFENLPPSGDLPYFLIAGKQFDDGLWLGDGSTYLRPGEERRVNIQLFPAGPPPEFGKIHGKVWRALENGREEFVPGALVLLFHGQPGEGNEAMRETHTDENGYYCFNELPPSGDIPYFLVAKRSFGDELWMGDAHTLLGPGEEKELYIRLYPQGPPPEFGSVEGTVWRMLEGNEEVVPEALVLLYHGAPGQNNRPLRETHTNDDGRYCFEELPPSGQIPYVVVAKKWFGNFLWQGLEDFHLAPGEDKEVNIRILPPVR